MLGEPMFSRVMVTIGLAVVIRSVVILIWGVEPTAFVRPFGSEPLRFAGLAMYPGQIFALVSLATLSLADGAVLSPLAASALRCVPRRTTKPRPC